jgi:hypothetical protein
MGSAIVNGVHWIQRQIASIDYPVERYILINNNGRGEITAELDALQRAGHEHIQQFHVVHMPANIGCAGAWNLIIKSSMMSPYWIICGHDIAFYPGFLQDMATHAEDPAVGMVHGSGGDHGIGSWSLFSIRDWIIRDYGLFDENFYPAYAEDLDYVMRLAHRPINRVIMDRAYQHGPGANDDYGSNGSQTWRTEPGLKERIDAGRVINEYEYMTNKWGNDWRWVNPWTNPWNQTNSDPGHWRWRLDFVRRKYLGF